MAPAGRAAFEARVENRWRYSYEQRPDELIEPYASMLARHAPAHRFFSHQTPSLPARGDLVGDQRQEGRHRVRRAESLIELSAQGRSSRSACRRESRGQRLGRGVHCARVSR